MTTRFLVAALCSTAFASRQTQLDQLLVGYDRMVRPGSAELAGTACTSAGGDDVTDVQSILQLLNLHSINEKQRSYQFDGYLDLSWYDSRLAYDDNVSCADELIFPSFGPVGLLWEPTVYVVETLHEQIGGASGGMAALGESMIIRRDGRVLWRRRVRYVLLCATFNWGQLPFDVQHCTFELRSFSYDASQVSVSWLTRTWGANDDASALPPPYISSEWTVQMTKRTSLNVSTIGIAQTPYAPKAVARACIRLTRDSVTYTFTLSVSVLLVFAAYCGFVIAPDRS